VTIHVDVHSLIRPISWRTRHGVVSVSWFGEPVAVWNEPGGPAALARVMYRYGYSSGQVVPFEPVPGDRPRHRIRWEGVVIDPRIRAIWPGWSVSHSASRTHLSHRGQPTILAPHGVDLGPNSLTAVELSAVSQRRLPGWIHLVHGESRFVDAPLRMYINTGPATAQRLASTMPALLLDLGFNQFALKFAATDEHRSRSDSTVVYLPGRLPVGALGVLIRHAESATVDDRVPLMTFRAADGVGIAQGTADGESFGFRRCRQIADAIRRDRRSDTGLEPAELPFDPRAPWNEASHLPIESLVTATQPVHRDRTAVEAERALIDFADELRSTAIVGSAGASWLVRDQTSGRFRAAGADVYGGSAGALLVLANAVHTAGGHRFAPTLRAAAENMLARMGHGRANGFHEGSAGTAACLAEAAVVSGDADLLQIARNALLIAQNLDAGDDAEWDVVSGLAGHIIGLASAADLLEREVPADLADLVRRLEGRARIDPATDHARWRMRLGRRRPALAGLAHGGSGAALAISLGRPRLDAVPDLVRQTVQFEDECRKNSLGWTDHRYRRPADAAVAWCHGAVGIGLASAAMSLQFNDPLLGQRTMSAVRRTAAALGEPPGEAGLCHGVAGRVLALFVMGRALAAPEFARVTADAARHLNPESAGADISLMNGRSGVVLCKLAVTGLAPPPLAFVLSPVLWRGER
jgi:hypothetical protein